MLLLPIGQEDSSVRRLPWVTFTLMGLCVAAFLATLVVNADAVEDASAKLEKALAYYFSHPYLELDERLEKLLVQQAGERNLQAMKELGGQLGLQPPSDAEQIQQQEELDQLTAAAFAAIDQMPYYRWGLVPAEMNVVSLVTHMFLHGGLMHLIGNMLILFLAGPFIEDVWGRPLYAGFYVVSGLAAALTFVGFYPGLQTPMIGASGAIAGIMGAFLIRHAASRIQFFYMVGFFIRGTFFAPAWLMLPLWLVQQVFMGMMMDGLGIEGGGGVAYWAHVGGFVWGAVAALAIKQLKVEERYIQPAIESKVTVLANPVIDQAYEALEQGRPDEAFSKLSEALRADPDNDDVAWTLWDVALRNGWAAQAAPAMQRVIERTMRSGDVDDALNSWYELISQVPKLVPDPRLSLMMARANQERGHQEWVLDGLRRATAGISVKTPAALALKVAQAAQPLDPELARQAAGKALGLQTLGPEEEQLARQIAEPKPAPA
jgi:membrane associated rhomboid family serine protease